MTELFTDTVLNMMTTTAEPEDYTGEDGLLYCGKCRTCLLYTSLRYANDVPIASICKITGLSRFAIYRKTARILKYLKTELQKGGFSDE